MAEIAGSLQQGFDFFPAEDQGQLSFATGKGNALDVDFPMEGMGIEEAEGTSTPSVFGVRIVRSDMEH